MYALLTRNPCSQISKEVKLLVTCFSFMQAYFAFAEGLKRYATLKVSMGKPSWELMSDIHPCMTKAHCILKRKLGPAYRVPVIMT